MGGVTAAAEMPAVWAAMGVDFLMFLKPSVPHDVLTMDFPALSVTWMCVLAEDRQSMKPHTLFSITSNTRLLHLLSSSVPVHQRTEAVRDVNRGGQCPPGPGGVLEPNTYLL